jgi:hypothetical protein
MVARARVEQELERAFAVDLSTGTTTRRPVTILNPTDVGRNRTAINEKAKSQSVVQFLNSAGTLMPTSLEGPGGKVRWQRRVLTVFDASVLFR